MKLHKSLLIGIICFIPALLNAQIKQEIGVYLGGGLSSLNYKNVSTDFSDRLGFMGGFSYNYFITNNWSLKSGLELSYYHAKADLNSIEGSVDAIDDEKESFKYQYTIGGYNETQKAYLINIPVMASFQTNRSNATTNLYVSGGFKLGLPISSKYKSNMSSITTKGYYPKNNVTYTDFIFRGIGSFSDINSNGNLKTNLQVLASLEFGIKNKIGDKLYLYSGLYFDYGLNSLTKKDKTLIQYNEVLPKDIHNQSILNSNYINADNASSSIVKGVHPIAFGIKINVVFEL